MKNKLLLRYIVSIFVLMSVLSAKAQDPNFSQFYANPLYLNPALTGAAFDARIFVNYRNQWPSFDANFVTYSVSYDQYIDQISSSFGFLVNTDRAGEGILSSSSYSGFYSYSIKVSRDIYINAGLQATFIQKKLDWGLLRFADSFDPINGYQPNISKEVPPDDNSVNLFDFSAGAAIGYKDFLYGGIAVHHIGQPYNGFYEDHNSQLYRKYTIHGGAVIDLQRRRRAWRAYNAPTISPNIMYTQQLNFKQLNVGVYLNKYPFVVGTWFRHNITNPDAFIILFGFTYEMFKFGYSYDISVNKLANASGGAHEVSLSFSFKNPKKTKKRRAQAIPCPSF